jgi:hypothetical protein
LQAWRRPLVGGVNLAIASNGWGFGTASNYRQPIAREAFQAAVPVSQVLS